MIAQRYPRIAHTSLAALLNLQAKARAGQAQSFAVWLQSQGKAEVIEKAWPVKAWAGEGRQVWTRPARTAARPGTAGAGTAGLHLTAEALQAAVDEDQERAAGAVRELDRLGAQTLVTAVTAWCDTLINVYRQATEPPTPPRSSPGGSTPTAAWSLLTRTGCRLGRGGRAGSSPPAPRWTTRPVMRCWVRCRTTRPRLGSMW